jgi:hypothetical protein
VSVRTDSLYLPLRQRWKDMLGRAAKRYAGPIA